MTETEIPEAESAIFNCSFCGKSQKDVKKLIAGPGEIFICDECVDLCAEIVSEDSEEPKPSEQQLAAAWSAMLKSRANTARTAEAELKKLVRQALSKEMPMSAIAQSVGISVKGAEARFGPAN